MEIIEKQVEKVKEVPADNYGYNYGRRDINGKANAGLTLGIIGTALGAWALFGGWKSQIDADFGLYKSMVTIVQLTDNLKSYISSQLESMSKSSPVIGFMKPLITRALDKNFSKITKALELIADKDGNVDVEGILTEMMENLMTTNPFSFKTSFIGDIEMVWEA